MCILQSLKFIVANWHYNKVDSTHLTATYVVIEKRVIIHSFVVSLLTLNLVYSADTFFEEYFLMSCN